MTPFYFELWRPANEYLDDWYWNPENSNNKYRDGTWIEVSHPSSRHTPPAEHPFSIGEVPGSNPGDGTTLLKGS